MNSNTCHSCAIEGFADEDMHNDLCFRCCAEAGTGCAICQTKNHKEKALGATALFLMSMDGEELKDTFNRLLDGIDKDLEDSK